MWWGLFSWLAVLTAILTRAVRGGTPERRAALANSVAFLLVVAGYVVLRVAARPEAGFL